MEHVNPLRRIRLASHYSQERLSLEYYMSRQLIVNNENGQYTKPSPALLQALLQLDPEVNEYQLIAEYQDWQKETRRKNYGILLPDLPLSWHAWQHPVVRWAEVSNVAYTKISRLLCIHQGLMNRLKNQAFLMTSLPTSFTDALIDSGYSFQFTTELESRFQAYKHNEREKVVA